MEWHRIKRWAFFFCGILSAIIIADTLSAAIVSLAGFTGGARFIAGFILYAAFFFLVLYSIERITSIRFFHF